MFNFLNQFPKLLLDFFNKPKELSGDSKFCLIGPSYSGKTVFLITLARWPNPVQDSPIESVTPGNDSTKRLVSYANNILENYDQIAGTDYPEDPSQLPTYTFGIKFKSTFSGKSSDFEVSCRDYSGSLWEDLKNTNLSNQKQLKYLEDIGSFSNFLVLVDSTSSEDEKYAKALTSLKHELNLRWEKQKTGRKNIRIAIVFSKTEDDKIWIYRHDLRDFINRKFFHSTTVLKKWEQEWKCSINYFFCSAFGIMGEPPQANARVEDIIPQGTLAVIKKPNVWRPLGLVAPIYWLHTGKDDQRLRKLEAN